jgi:hypothetical protein
VPRPTTGNLPDIQHPSPELEEAMRALLREFWAYLDAPSTAAKKRADRALENFRHVGHLVIFGEPP